MNKPATNGVIAYRWALDPLGRPVPISFAQHGQRYQCPLCKGRMIARLGEQLQHHFAHEDDTGCTPEAVARAAVRRWIAIQLREAVDRRQVIKVQWACTRCGNHHSGDILEGVTQIHEGYLWDSVHYADVAAVDAAGNVRAVILVQDEEIPAAETLEFFSGRELFTILIPVSVTPADSDFSSLLAQGSIAGAPCPMLQKATNILQDPDRIRQALREAVARWPGYFYGPLETVDGLSNVVKLGNQALWLPSERWRDIVGGTRNPLAPGVQVMVQNWPHSDGGVIWLYYVIARDTGAVGVRRYGPGQTPMPYLNAQFRQRRVTALDLTRELVTQ